MAVDACPASSLVSVLRARGAASVLFDLDGRPVTVKDVFHQAEGLARRLAEEGVQTLGLQADNGLLWWVAAIAARAGGLTLVPVPSFFTPAQQQHVLRDAGVDALLTPAHADQQGELMPGYRLERYRCRQQPPEGCALVTYTSGTTGSPRGVCLEARQLDQVAAALAEVVIECGVQRHLQVLPLSVLLEQVAGEAVLRGGGTLVLSPLARLGWVGMAGIDTERLADRLRALAIHSAVIVPDMLAGLMAQQQLAPLTDMRLLALGGGHTPPARVADAMALGLPVLEGYGLSECASVVALNRPGQAVAGSVGHPLSHVEVRIRHGEVQVRGNSLLGYLHDDTPRAEWLATGDLGRLDDEGRLWIEGRRKHVIVTGLGRNVSPEWIEAELTAEPLIDQAMVYGDEQVGLRALLVSSATDDEIDGALARVHARLPAYARLNGWARHAPFTREGGELTANGRLRRALVLSRPAALTTAVPDALAPDMTSYGE
ncbi:AMP-binding protein [Larsenimonas rhizosphaerae]|uniref:AMP-binding protein n=1 Tax=Larsenimonas rhizosphaerae TaxID=2944682 RepID=UPI002033359C|nr:AMP-binding protein [Larsenimonas rhizosphaerae]MCM2131976.1 AMP-binding protein [Larsenimonas rhizosphaerae]